MGIRSAGFLLAAAVAASVAACGGGGGGGSGGAAPIPAPIQIQIPPQALAPGDDIAMCYYTTIPSGAAINVSAIQSTMPSEIVQLVLLRTPVAARPDGTVEACGAATAAPVWVYGTQSMGGSLTLPAGVGLPLQASQPVYVKLHYLNTTASSVSAQATITLQPVAGTVQLAGTLTSFNTQINIAPGGVGSASGQCSVPSGAQFFWLSTYTHNHATSTRINRFAGSTGALVLESLDWQHPTVNTYTTPYLTFGGNEQLQYTCDYTNAGLSPLVEGESPTSEKCMTAGYYFPATENHSCANSIDVPQPF
ncbi:MAG TPA: hypothetical protein VJO54_11525 [Burkholderiales bacterium]|nr:hypothetical protein [Burkholderiales bacterium]